VASRTRTEPSPVRWLLRLIAVGYVFLLVAWPTSMIARETFADGLQGPLDALADPAVQNGLRLTAIVAGTAVVINTVFGVGIALLLTRYDFRGKRLLSALIDVPLSVSPVVVGLALLLVYSGRYGWFGQSLEERGFQVIFATPGMIMATAFVALPLVIREVVPVLNELGDEQEQAGRSLGANAWQTFRRITLPSIKWAVVYGVVLSMARSLGEFGAVKIVSPGAEFRGETATILIQNRYTNYEEPTAYAAAFVLVLASVLALVVVSLIRKPDHQ
jgi:sulfate/thiosulfate transport system permease protein